MTRAAIPDAVEGRSEIDVVMRGPGYLLVAEASLTSDISVSTTYDPNRNQIARNIDCVLENADTELPIFWMIVKDRGPGRMYVQLIDQWRQDPAALIQMLPHRAAFEVEAVMDRCAVITWDEILEAIEPATEDEFDLWAELLSRTN